MPLPLILGVGAIAAGVTGVGTGIHGAVKMKEANDTMEKAKACHAKTCIALKKRIARQIKAWTSWAGWNWKSFTAFRSSRICLSL